MVAVKSSEIASFLKSAGERIEVYLVFGTDTGQVSETAKAISAGLAAVSSPPGEIIRLSDQDLAQTPGRLTMEARSLPMFGGRPVIMVKHSPQLTQNVISDLLEGGPLAGFVVIEAGNLKRDAKIRQICEKAKNAAGVVCYGADERNLPQLIRDDIKAAGLKITADAVDRLTHLLGADWAVSRSEIAKLALYAADDSEITLAHVEAIVGDASAHAFDAAIKATFAGEIKEALAQLDGLVASGTPASVFLMMLLRHSQTLHQLLSAMERGESFEVAVGRLRPPPHFRQKAALKAQCARWRLADIATGISTTHEALRQTRLKPALEQDIAGEIIIAMAQRNTHSVLA
jgi:DNA polymerase-3 subunit delta